MSSKAMKNYLKAVEELEKERERRMMIEYEEDWMDDLFGIRRRRTNPFQLMDFPFRRTRRNDNMWMDPFHSFFPTFESFFGIDDHQNEDVFEKMEKDEKKEEDLKEDLKEKKEEEIEIKENEKKEQSEETKKVDSSQPNVEQQQPKRVSFFRTSKVTSVNGKTRSTDITKEVKSDGSTSKTVAKSLDGKKMIMKSTKSKDGKKEVVKHFENINEEEEKDFLEKWNDFGGLNLKKLKEN